MRHRSIRLIPFICVICLIFSACTTPTPVPTPVPVLPTATPTLAAIGRAAPALAAIPRSAGKLRTLAFNPEREIVALYAENEAPLIVLTKQPSTSFMLRCGSNTASASATIGLFLGSDIAQPMLIPLDGGAIVPLGETIGLTCALEHRFQFSPDRSQIGLLLYQSDALKTPYSSGKLQIMTAPDGVPVHQASQTVAFRLYDNAAVYLQFYADDEGRAVTADLNYWDGTIDRTLQADILPLGRDCQFITGQVIRAARRVYSLIGERCRSNGTTWRLLETDLMDGSTINLTATGSPGGFLLNVTSPDFWLLPNQVDLLMAIPSGQDADTVTLYHFGADRSQTRLLQNVIVDQYPPSSARRFQFSPDGQWLTCVTRDSGGVEALYLYNLNAPSDRPIRIAGGTRGDRIIDLAWGADSNRLFIARTGDDNTLTTYELSSERTRLITRGLFQSLTPSPDGSHLAAIEQQRTTNADYRYDLILLNTSTAAKVTLVEGKSGTAPIQPIALR